MIIFVIRGLELLHNELSIEEPLIKRMAKFPIIRQLDAMDCGAACLAMICAYHGQDRSLAELREVTFVDRDGVSLLNIKSAAEKIGFETLPVKVSYLKLVNELPLPAIAHWDQNHFVVVYTVTPDHVIIGDPAVGERKLTRQEFEKYWNQQGVNNGVILLLEYPEEEVGKMEEPTLPSDMDSTEEVKEVATAALVSTGSASSIFTNLKGNIKFWIHLVVGSIMLFLIYLFLPFVIKELIDTGAILKDTSVVHTGLFAFAMLGLGRILLELSRNWMFQQEAAVTNARLISIYLEKLTKQPIRFFERRLKWDILQRIYDNYKVGAFFQSSSIQAIFYLIMLLSSSIVLLLMHELLFIFFLVGLILQIGVTLFFRQRRLYAKQSVIETSGRSQDLLFEIINGISAIKLNNAQQYNQSIWEEQQGELLEKNLAFNKIDQFQKTAIKIIGWITELIVLYFALKIFMQGDLTLGSIMGIIYILAYSKNAIVELFDLLIDYQEVKLSLLRLAEMGDLPVKEYEISNPSYIPTYKDIEAKSLSFRYGDKDSPLVIDDVNLIIPKGKKTAIVGVSGSGKTTLVKLLVGLYTPITGSVSLGKLDLQDVNPTLLNDKLAVVFEDGYIFSDSILANIIMNEGKADKTRLKDAIEMACLDTFMETLPLGYNTRIGEEGIQLSRGQKQMVLLARAFYKQPEILVFDESTNALDGITERRLLKNLNDAYENKTLIFVAHRLSSIKDADQIIVLHKGIIVEQGTHAELLEKRGAYFLILRNDLE